MSKNIFKIILISIFIISIAWFLTIKQEMMDCMGEAEMYSTNYNHKKQVKCFVWHKIPAYMGFFSFVLILFLIIESKKNENTR